MGLGLTRNRILEITGLTKHQFYHPASGKKPGRQGSQTTRYKEPATGIISMVENTEVVDKIVDIKLKPDLPNWYRLITTSLQLSGYYINHKKVYRLMDLHMLLEEPRKRTGRNFVKYGRVTPMEPLRNFEMDIKYFWIHGARKYAFVLTILDIFTRYALKWVAGYTMKAIQVKEAWEEVIANYLQPAGIRDKDVEVEIRNDNGKQFSANILTKFFSENQIKHVFTHPYTPEENGHVESFHSILGKSLGNDAFADLNGLELRLDKFYGSYNNNRCHSATAGLPPAKFWALHDLNKIEIVELSKGRIKFKLKVAYQDIISLPGIDKYEHRGIRT